MEDGLGVAVNGERPTLGLGSCEVRVARVARCKLGRPEGLIVEWGGSPEPTELGKLPLG